MRYAAFLRGINLGDRRVTGEQLCAPLVELGFDNVASFLASGNLAFDADPDSAADADDFDAGHDLEVRIAAQLEAALGFPVETFVRTAAEVSGIVSRQPFPAEVVAASAGKPQVTFVRTTPSPEVVEAVLAHETEEDRLGIHGREWYWLPSAGVSKSRLDIRAIERAVGRGTTRTLTTVTRLHTRLLAGNST